MPHEMPGMSLSERICFSWRPRRAAAGEEAVPLGRGGVGGKLFMIVVEGANKRQREVK